MGSDERDRRSQDRSQAESERKRCEKPDTPPAPVAELAPLPPPPRADAGVRRPTPPRRHPLVEMERPREGREGTLASRSRRESGEGGQEWRACFCTGVVAPPEGRSSPPRNPMTRSEGVGGSGTAPGVGQGADGSIATGRVKLLSLRVSHSL